jgi:hypothetical protein
MHWMAAGVYKWLPCCYCSIGGSRCIGWQQGVTSGCIVAAVVWIGASGRLPLVGADAWDGSRGLQVDVLLLLWHGLEHQVGECGLLVLVGTVLLTWMLQVFGRGGSTRCIHMAWDCWQQGVEGDCVHAAVTSAGAPGWILWPAGVGRDMVTALNVP